MKVTRRNEISPYDAPRHFGMQSFRLQGGEVSQFRDQVGLSVFYPGGGAEQSASAMDRVYVVLSGELTITVKDTQHLLCEFDSCFIPAGEERAILNRGALPVYLIAIIAPPANA